MYVIEILDKEFNGNYAIVKINTGTPYGGKKALLHVNRLWIWNKPMFGGWTALQRISSKNFAINARSIDTIGKPNLYL